MKFKLSLLTMGAALAATVVMVPAQAQYNPKDKAQMRQLAFETCSKSSKADACNCFADNLVKNFNEKDWTVFIADASKKSAPPAGVSESDIDAYGKKLAAAGNTCGM